MGEDGDGGSGGDARGEVSGRSGAGGGALAAGGDVVECGGGVAEGAAAATRVGGPGNMAADEGGELSDSGDGGWMERRRRAWRRWTQREALGPCWSSRN